MRIFALSFLLCCYTFCSQAQSTQLVTPANTDWQKIAETIMVFGKDSAVINIKGVERYMSFYFHVINGGIDLQSMKVYYENGEMQDFAINEKVKPEANSRVFDLVGDARKMKSVVIKYQPMLHSDDRAARVELWASQTKRIR